MAWSIIASITLFYFGSTFIWPNAFSIAFTPYGKIAGYAGALYGFMQIGGAAVIGSLVSFLPDKNQLPLALVFIFAPAFAWGVFESIRLHFFKVISASESIFGWEYCSKKGILCTKSVKKISPRLVC